jgi:hypothetical protein
MAVGGHRTHPGRFSPGKETHYPLYRRVWRPQCRSGRVRKNSPRFANKCRQFRRNLSQSRTEGSPSWCWVTFHMKLHLTCNIRKPNTVSNFPTEFQCSFWKPSRIITPLATWHSTSSGCRWREQPPDVEGSCKYINIYIYISLSFQLLTLCSTSGGWTRVWEEWWINADILGKKMN